MCPRVLRGEGKQRSWVLQGEMLERRGRGRVACMCSGVGPGDRMSCLEGAAWSGLPFGFSGVCLLVLSLAASFQLVLYPRPCLSAGGWCPGCVWAPAVLMLGMGLEP